jgi:hypothetical protein
MRSRNLLQLAVMSWLLFASVQPAQPGDSKPAPAAAAAPADSKSPVVQIQAQVVEIHGDVKAALEQAGFANFAQGDRTRVGMSAFVFDTSSRSSGSVASHPNSNRDPLDGLFRKYPETTMLCNAHVKTVMGQAANLMISAAPPTLPYLVRTGEKTFELKQFVAERLGVTLQFTPQPDADDPRMIRISPLSVATTTLDARESIPGVDLEIGKPIVSTRKLETSIRLVDGPNQTGVILPGPEGRQLVLFVTAQRVREPRLGEVLPSPPPGQ